MKLRIHSVSFFRPVKNAPGDAVVFFNLYRFEFFCFHCSFLLGEFLSSLFKPATDCQGNQSGRPYYRWYSVLVNPLASISLSRLSSTKDFGSAPLAFGLSFSTNPSTVSTPRSDGYGGMS